MSYTKHTWASGDVVTAAKLNNLEDGVSEALAGGGGGGDMFVVNVTATPTDDVGYNFATETAYADVLAAFEAGKVVMYWVAFHNDNGIRYTSNIDVMVMSDGTIDIELGPGLYLYHTADGIVEYSD